MEAYAQGLIQNNIGILSIVIGALLTYLLAAYVRNLVDTFLSYRYFKGSQGFGVGSQIAFPTSQDPIICNIVSTTFTTITALGQDNQVITIPMKGHQNIPWVVLNTLTEKKKPDVPVGKKVAGTMAVLLAIATVVIFALSAPAHGADLDPEVQELLEAFMAQKNAPAVEAIAVPVPGENSINIDDLIAAIQGDAPVMDLAPPDQSLGAISDIMGAMQDAVPRPTLGDSAANLFLQFLYAIGAAGILTGAAALMYFFMDKMTSYPTSAQLKAGNISVAIFQSSVVGAVILGLSYVLGNILA
jgi:hypothetical protein